MIVQSNSTSSRFSPKEGRPDPAVSLARLEKALEALRRVSAYQTGVTGAVAFSEEF